VRQKPLMLSQPPFKVSQPPSDFRTPLGQISPYATSI
jgi:hypothetical protein